MKLQSVLLSLTISVGAGAGAIAGTEAKATNPNYEFYPGLNLIERDLSGLKRVYRRNYSKFISYVAPNGGQILLVATDGQSDRQ